MKRIAGAGDDSLDVEFNMHAITAVCELLEYGYVGCERHGNTVLLTLTQEGYRQERALRRRAASFSARPTRQDKNAILRGLKDGPVFGGRTLVKRVAVAGGHFAAWEPPQLFAAEVRAAFKYFMRSDSGNYPRNLKVRLEKSKTTCPPIPLPPRYQHERYDRPAALRRV